MERIISACYRVGRVGRVGGDAEHLIRTETMMKRMTGMMACVLLVTVALWGASAQGAAKYKVTAVKNGASVSGRVTLKGKQPPPEQILITKNKDVCGAGNRAIQWVPVGQKNGLTEMVVFLKKVKQGKDWSGSAAVTKGEMNQEKCVFSPWLQIVRKGAEVTVKNSDPVLHNIHIRELIGIKVGKARGVKRTMLNEAQPGSAEEKASDLKARIKPRRGNFIAINCEAHNFMFAWMFAADHPYVVKTGADGSYTLTDIPPGKYVLSAWHPTLGLLEKKIKIKADQKLSHEFSYKAKK